MIIAWQATSLPQPFIPKGTIDYTLIKPRILINYGSYLNHEKKLQNYTAPVTGLATMTRLAER